MFNHTDHEEDAAFQLLHEETTTNTIKTLRARLAKLEAERDGLREALEGYRAAAQWVAADSWDGCTDCIEMLKMAVSSDQEFGMAPNDHAAALVRLRARQALGAKPCA